MTLGGPASASTFYNFESPQTHPIALSANGVLLFAVNTADNRLAVFDTATLARIHEIPVGLEPVSVAVRPNANEVWVVNHLSDSIDVVSTTTWAVTRTIPVGDEPAAVAFLPAGNRAYVTVSQRNLVSVIDATTFAVGPNIPLGTPPLNGNTEDPRALAVDPAGAFVYVIPFESGNQTRGAAPPLSDPNQPKATIVTDTNLTDTDLFVIRTSDNTIVNRIPKLGTLLTNVRINPAGTRLYLTGSDARNLSLQIENLNGHPTVNLLTILDRATLAVIRRVDLDGPLPYAPSKSVAQPYDIAFDNRGRIWIAAQGGDDAVVLDADGNRLSRLRAGTAPRGLAFDPVTARLFVFNRLSHDITVIDTTLDAVVATFPLGYDPTTPSVKLGRPFVYTASHSADRSQACVACHADGHLDNVVWDVGSNADPKGPMVTQTLRGLANAAPYHWRGERPDLLSFNVAFQDLFHGALLTPDDNQRLADFMASLSFYPNPNENRDGSLAGPIAHCGQELFMGQSPVDCDQGQHFNFPCVACHALPQGSNHQIIPAAALGTAEDMEVPGLRGLHDRVAFLNDGRDRTLVQFLSNAPPFPPFRLSDKQAMEAFVLQFPTDHHAAVGIERTANQGVCPGGALNPEIAGTISFLEAEANASVLDLAVAGTMAPFGNAAFLFDTATDRYVFDRTGPAPVASADLTAAACAGTASLTYTAWPIGMGPRARDRDEDAVLNGDEAAIGTDPGNPDTDGDGLLDGAEVSLGTNPVKPDSDGDGTMDGQEVADGTGPLNPGSFLHFVDAETSGGDVVLKWTTVFARKYSIQNFDGTTFVKPGDPFADLFTSPSPESESPEGTEGFVDTTSPVAPGTCRVYWLKALPPGS